jgi:hypothetical protein
MCSMTRLCEDQREAKHLSGPVGTAETLRPRIQPSLTGLFICAIFTQDCVLGYFQSSLRDSIQESSSSHAASEPSPHLQPFAARLKSSPDAQNMSPHKTCNIGSTL